MKINFFSNTSLKNFLNVQEFLEYVKENESLELTKENSKYEILASTEKIKDIELFQNLNTLYLYQIDVLSNSIEKNKNQNDESVKELFVEDTKNELLKEPQKILIEISNKGVDVLKNTDTFETPILETPVLETSTLETNLKTKILEKMDVHKEEKDVDKTNEISHKEKNVLNEKNDNINLINDKENDKENIKENKYEKNINIYGFSWEQIKEYQTSFLKFLIQYIWFEENFHPRCTLKHLHLKDEKFFFQSPKKNYSLFFGKQKTKYSLHKLVLAYTILSCLEKCPPEELNNSLLLFYVSKTFQLTLEDFLRTFQTQTFESSLEKCIHYYCILLPLSLEDKMKPEHLQLFHKLENEKKILEND